MKMRVFLFLAVSLLVGTGVAQTSPSITITCNEELTRYWFSGNSSNVEQPGFCVFSGDHRTVFAFESTFLYAGPVDSNGNALSDSVLVDTTNNPGTTIAFIDGNLSIRNAAGTKIFQTHTLGHPDAFLQVQDNGGIFIYDDKCDVLFVFVSAPETCVLPPGDS